jgi:hypothetical protein
MPKYLILDRGSFDLATQGTSEGKDPKEAIENAGPDVPMPEKVVLVEVGSFTSHQVVNQDPDDEIDLIVRTVTRTSPRDEPQLGPEGSRVRREQPEG